ncbi:hypothetical protein, partial [Paenibacillus oryzisoli]|uniref:hypothetical protein n=1 Tax=Paenibacillus oryzisoli TaxID=1850517 RepID=UPI00195DF9C5
TSQLNKLNLPHSTTSQLNKPNLTHSSTSQLNEPNLTHSSTSHPSSSTPLPKPNKKEAPKCFSSLQLKNLS